MSREGDKCGDNIGHLLLVLHQNIYFLWYPQGKAMSLSSCEIHYGAKIKKKKKKKKEEKLCSEQFS